MCAHAARMAAPDRGWRGFFQDGPPPSRARAADSVTIDATIAATQTTATSWPPPQAFDIAAPRAPLVAQGCPRRRGAV